MHTTRKSNSCPLQVLANRYGTFDRNGGACHHLNALNLVPPNTLASIFCDFSSHFRSCKIQRRLDTSRGDVCLKGVLGCSLVFASASECSRALSGSVGGSRVPSLFVLSRRAPTMFRATVRQLWRCRCPDTTATLPGTHHFQNIDCLDTQVEQAVPVPGEAAHGKVSERVMYITVQ